jgi:hemolysin III
MTKQDEIAQRAIRRSTLKSLKVKKIARICQIREKAAEEIREVNIMYAEDPERLRAKYAADDYARSERERKRAEHKIEIEKRQIELEASKRQYSAGEEISASIVQGLGAVMSVVATVLLILRAVNYASDSLKIHFITAYACAGLSLFLMYIMSTLHHALVPAGAKEVFNRLTHDFIFLVIACVYTAFSLTELRGTIGWILFGIAWGVAIVGIVFFSIYGNRLEVMNLAFYLGLGWAGLFVCKRLYDVLPINSFSILIMSGITYSISVVFYVFRKIKYMHVIGNVIMLMGTGYLFLSLLFQL